MDDETDRKDESKDKPNPSGHEAEPRSDTETDTEDTGKDLDNETGEVEKADDAVLEGDELKPTARAMLDVQQMVRDLWGMVTELESGIEDPEGMGAFIDLHTALAGIDQLCLDVLGSKGVKDMPKACSMDEMRSMRKSKSKTPSEPLTPNPDEEGIMKGVRIKYRPIRLGILRAGTVEKPRGEQVDPKRVKRLEDGIDSFIRRIERMKKREQLTN